jgi:hypothetical protein
MKGNTFFPKPITELEWSKNFEETIGGKDKHKKLRIPIEEEKKEVDK